MIFYIQPEIMSNILAKLLHSSDLDFQQLLQNAAVFLCINSQLVKLFVQSTGMDDSSFNLPRISFYHLP